MRKRHLVCVAATEQKGVYERSALDAELRGYRFMTFDFHALGRKEQAWQQGVHSITFFFFWIMTIRDIILLLLSLLTLKGGIFP